MDIDRLAEIAAQLAGRMREFGPDENARWLSLMLPEPVDWFRLSFVLAAAVPVNRPWLSLTSWTQPDSPELIAERRRQLDVALRGRVA